jgi:hypothetical protein
MEKQKIKKQLINKLILFGVMGIVILTWFNLGKIFPDKYTFVLNDEELPEIIQCEKQWHYETLDFIPCVYNNTHVVLFKDQLNYSLSPIANCENLNGTFPGFNTQNETRAKEVYDSLMPKCITIESKEINKEFLVDFGCVRDQNKKCYEWQKEDLIVRKI